MDWAAAARAVVVLIRGDDDDDTVFADAADGVAVMVVDPAMSWSELAAVVHGLVLEVARPDPPWPNGSLRIGRQFGRKLPAVRSSSRQALAGVGVLPRANTPTRQGGDHRRAAGPERLRDFFDMHGVYAQLAASDEPLFVPRRQPRSDRPHGGRVRSGRELMGSVWVECAAPLDGAARTAFLPTAPA